MATETFAFQRSNTGRSSSSPIDGDGEAREQDRKVREQKVIAFPVHASWRRGARSSDGASRSNVIDFRLRRRTSLGANATAKPHGAHLGKGQTATQEEDSYRHRMFTNFLAASWLILLVVAGNWMANALVTMP